MKSVESAAKTRQQAIQKGLDELDAELHEVQIEILDEGSRGLFGLGARDVKVRISVDTPDEEPQQAPKRPSRGRGGRGGRQRGERGGRNQRSEPSESKGSVERKDRPERKERKERPERKERKKRAERPKRSEGAERPASEDASRDEAREEARELAPVSDARREEATSLLTELIEKMGIEAKVTGEPTEDGGARLNVESEDSAILIGRKGRNLQALQYVLNRMMRGADAPDTVERFIVDIEDYLERRRESLEEMAQQLALKAKETGKEVRVKPLNPQERRIVHLTLQDDLDLRTFSLGNTSMRTIVISPKGATREDSRSRRSRGGSRGGSRRGRRGGRQRNGDADSAANDVQTEAPADAQADVQTDTQTDVQADVQTDVQTEAPVDVQADVEAAAAPDTAPEPVAQGDAQSS